MPTWESVPRSEAEARQNGVRIATAPPGLRNDKVFTAPKQCHSEEARSADVGIRSPERSGGPAEWSTDCHVAALLAMTEF